MLQEFIEYCRVIVLVATMHVLLAVLKFVRWFTLLLCQQDTCRSVCQAELLILMEG